MTNIKRKHITLTITITMIKRGLECDCGTLYTTDNICSADKQIRHLITPIVTLTIK